MPPTVVTGATLACSMGTAPATLVATSPTAVATTPMATVDDRTPANIVPTPPVPFPFGLCVSPANPAVAAATTAALGVLTPQPCVPVIPAPWVPGSLTVQLRGRPALTSTCTCTCQWAGVVTVASPGQVAVQET